MISLDKDSDNWQKIALCRIFFKQADLYFLDEPNAFMDSIAEDNTLKEYKKSLNNKIGIVIVHKIKKYIDCVDKIVVLNNGSIENMGSHRYLLNNCQEYVKLFNNQN